MHDASATTLLVRDMVVMFGVALAFVLVFRRFGLGATLGYLVAGAVVGPQVLGIAGQGETIIGFAEIGITMLLFIVGLELSPNRLWTMKHEIFGLGLLQVTLCGVALTGLLLLTTGFTLAAALAIGLPLALSSTAQVLPMLQSGGRLQTPQGGRAFSILLFQDLSLIPLLTIVAALSRNPADAASGPAGWQAVLTAIVAVTGLIVAGRFLVRPLFRLISKLGEREMFIVAALVVVLGSAAVMEALGLSAALGAFIAGVMLADTPFRHELEADVEPFRSILLGLFFLAVGMMLDLSVIAANPLFVIGMVAALILVKTLVIGGLGLALGMTWRAALALGLLLSQGGEFGFVLFTRAQQGMLIEESAASLFGAIVTVSMMLTPLLMLLTRRIRQEPKGPKEEREEPHHDGAGVIMVGYGRFGQTVAQMLICAGISVTLIDDDADQIDMAQKFGAKVYFGDGQRLDLLRQAGASEADLIMFCDDREQDPSFLRSVREAFPDAKIYLRVFDRRNLITLHGAPFDYAIREMLESAVQMARAALEDLGDSIEEIDRAEQFYRKRDIEMLDVQKDKDDMFAASHRVITPETREAKRGED